MTCLPKWTVPNPILYLEFSSLTTHAGFRKEDAEYGSVPYPELQEEAPGSNPDGWAQEAVKLKAGGTHTPTHGLASTSRMRTAISPWQWQPWTAVSPLLRLISMAWPSGQWTGKISVYQRPFKKQKTRSRARWTRGRIPSRSASESRPD